MRPLLMILACIGCASLAHAADDNPPLLEIVRIVSLEDGTTRFAEGAVPLERQDFAPPAPPVSVSARLPATDLAFVSLPAGYFGGWHPAPRRQYGMILAGRVEIETGDGEKREFGSGALFLLEDDSGRGHQTRVVGDAPAVIALVPVAATEAGTGQ